jgi:DNA invertase Pin-like site-specific DNA recombinase
MLDDWQTRGMTFVTIGEGIDTSTPAGRLVAGVFASIAEFERARSIDTCARSLARRSGRSARRLDRDGEALAAFGGVGSESLVALA